jgi:hypothetical protein
MPAKRCGADKARNPRGVSVMALRSLRKRSGDPQTKVAPWGGRSRLRQTVAYEPCMFMVNYGKTMEAPQVTAISVRYPFGVMSGNQR